MRGQGGLRMNRGTWLTIGLVAASVLLAGCGSPAESAPERPSQIVPVQGTSVNRVILTPRAIQRIGLQTAPVQQPAAPDSGASVAVPLAAVIYLSDGTAWVYTVAGPRTYVRQSVTVARTSGDMAVLQAGPPVGTVVVTTGAAELLGSEYGVAGGQ
jgi:hypothetical protein